MLLKDSLYGLAVQRSLIPEPVSLFLNFLSIEVCQNVFQF